MTDRLIIDDYLDSFPETLLMKIDLEETRRFNQWLIKHGVQELVFKPLTYCLTAYVVKEWKTIVEILDRLSLESIQDYDWFETGFISLFEGQILLDETLYRQVYFYFFDMIANGHPKVYGLKKSEQEYIYLENTAVTGGVRVLEYQDKLVLLTLSGYD